VAEAESGRARLLDEIETRRRAMEQYLDAKRPVSSRLTTISVISSCVAAALAAAPALGGKGFTDTVGTGLALGQSEAVWRLLCFAAAAASVAAAIAANLSKSSDLAERVAGTEAAHGLLDGLRARVRFSRLPMAEAAQQYQEIIARVPWVSGPDTNPGHKRSRITKRPAPYLLGTTSIAASFAVVAVVGLVAGLVRGTPPAPTQAVAQGAATETQASDERAPQAVVPVARQVFSGPISGGTSLAIVVDGGRAAAYLCDGRALEAWFEGEVRDDRVSLTGRNGAELSATIDGTGLTGSGSAKGRSFDFGLATASPPAGVYEAKIEVNGTPVRLGWAVLPGGQQLGVENRSGRLSPAPNLTLPAGTFELSGATHTAKLLSGTDDVVPS
jgi:hypothetical protein